MAKEGKKERKTELQLIDEDIEVRQRKEAAVIAWIAAGESAADVFDGHEQKFATLLKDGEGEEERGGSTHTCETAILEKVPEHQADPWNAATIAASLSTSINLLLR